MKSHAEKIIEPEDYSLFLKIRDAINAFDDTKFDYGLDIHNQPAVLSCHMLAEAISRIYPDLLTLESGYYHIPYEHSWLVTKFGNILDVYPVGTIAGPLLIDRHSLPSRKTVYIRRESIMDDIRQCVDYYNAVYHIEYELRGLLGE